MACRCVRSSSQYLRVASNTAFQFGTGNFTIAMQINPESLIAVGFNSIISVGQYDDGILFRYNSATGTGGDGLYIKGTFYNWQPASRVTVGSWLPVVISRIGSTVDLYLGGTSILTVTNNADVSPTTATTIGSATHSAAEGWDGFIAEVAIWKGAGLTAAEALALSKGFTADQIRPQSLSFYTPLVRNFQDVRGGLAITNNNGATVATHPRTYT